ncbi:phytoene/squalene synthase family protein [Roseomonas sp. CCTCC AB2023176]|uniref:phytoene/squalene synthase family protein n=1 Tax=Roseomonas sp. CCTCC AB2023176 TaxID=3342640 RepID=UPI0035D89890
MAETPALSAVGAIARRHDPDRFFCALFAPAERREAVFTLVAFNHELARAREVASQPMLALIRLQWWRDAIEEVAAGRPPRRHEVVEPLAGLLRAGEVEAGDLTAMVDARDAEAGGPPASRAAMLAWLRGTSGALAVLTGRLLGAPSSVLPALQEIGLDYGVAGVLRSLPAYAASGRSPLPADEVTAAGLATEGAVDPASPAVRRIGGDLAGDALRRLSDASAGLRVLPRTAFAAALPGALARRDLRRIAAPGWAPTPAAARGLGDRLAVVRAWALRRM